MTQHNCTVLLPEVCYRCALNLDEIKGQQRMMSEQFADIWDKNYEFFNLPALNGASADSQLLKLREELTELEDDHSVEEAADVLVCLVGFLIKSDVSLDEFLDVFEAKTDVNLARRWEQRLDGTFKHIKET